MANVSSTKEIPSKMASNGNSSNVSEVAGQARGLGQEQLRILDVIDSLRSATPEDVKLPQLVVVGDQSAGKSSVLDAISGIPIPKDPDGCTRFATEYRLRRGTDNISVGIIPSKSRSPEDKDKFSQLRWPITDKDQLSDCIKKCEDAIFDGDKTGSGRFASRDIMTIDICGPTMPLLTLIDLPGFIHAANSKQTKDDIAAINEIAVDYMSRPRTVILAVVAGSTHYATQVVLDKVSECDKGGVRTLGIVTKPDLLSNDVVLEDKFLKLVKNEDIKLKLGWHVLRNRTPHEMEMNMETDVRNQKEEEFFTQGKWKTLRADARGVESLVAKLSDLLFEHIKGYLPQLLKEIQEGLARSEEELDALGHRVDTVPEMKSEVSKLFSRSQSLIKSGINGHYLDQRGFFHIGDNESFTQISPQNLRARIRRENIEFEKEMRTRGCQVRLVGKGVPDREYDNPEDADSEDSPLRVKMEDYETKTVQRYLYAYVGQQLPGDYDPSIVFLLFTNYSAKWDKIAHNHQDKVQGIVTQFLQQVVNHVWPQRMRAHLWSALLNKKVEALQTRAKEELERLLLDRRRCHPIYGPEYFRRLKELQDRSASEKVSPAGEIVQRMLVYYELASNIFISNVIVQVAERHLIDGLRTVFDISELIQMDDQTLTSLAAEDEHNKTKREDLERKVTGLKKARDDCLAITRANIQKPKTV
ncbi:dynamin family protein [Trichoderma gamsii]|uniref:Dynamin family protein n=1 Tax=Trichoderma gamsii TaxID=398673 RepID=A0A2P4ZK63_9HYPO|nr:dynamin family protein [Trichoderma gamsii]PON24652.1 dynamin family protein [Trichoderma gamsii]